MPLPEEILPPPTHQLCQLPPRLVWQIVFAHKRRDAVPPLIFPARRGDAGSAARLQVRHVLHNGHRRDADLIKHLHALDDVDE